MPDQYMINSTIQQRDNRQTQIKFRRNYRGLNVIVNVHHCFPLCPFPQKDECTDLIVRNKTFSRAGWLGICYFLSHYLLVLKYIYIIHNTQYTDTMHTHWHNCSHCSQNVIIGGTKTMMHKKHWKLIFVIVLVITSFF